MGDWTDSGSFILWEKPETPEERWQREAQAEVDAICTSLNDQEPTDA